MKTIIVTFITVLTLALISIYWFFGGEKVIVEGIGLDRTYIGDYDSSNPANFSSFVLNVFKAGSSSVEEIGAGNSYRVVAMDENGSICDQKYFDVKIEGQAQPNCTCTTEPCVCPFPVEGGFKIILKCRTAAKKWLLYSGDKLLGETSTLQEKN